MKHLHDRAILFSHTDPGNKLFTDFVTEDSGNFGKSLNANADATLLKDIGFFIVLDHDDSIADILELLSI